MRLQPIVNRNEMPTQMSKSDDSDVGSNDDCGKDEGVRKRTLHPVDIVPIIVEYHKEMVEGMSKNSFQKYARNKFNRPKFQMESLHGWLVKGQQRRLSAKNTDKDRCSIAVPRTKVGHYLRMEYHLAARLRDLRPLIMPIETWMVRAKADQLLFELYQKNWIH